MKSILKPLLAQLRAAVQDADRPRAAIAAAAGIGPATLAAFLEGSRNHRLLTLDKIARGAGLEFRLVADRFITLRTIPPRKCMRGG
jgi:hypothetical protein